MRSATLSTGYRTDRLDAASTAIRVRTIDLNEVVKRADRCRRVLSRAGFSCRVYQANADQGLLDARRALS